MLHSNIFTDRITTPGSATKRQGCTEFEIVNITNRPLRCWHVNDDSAGFHVFAKIINTRAVFGNISVECGSMPYTAQFNKRNRFLNSSFERISFIHCKCRRQFLVGKWFIMPDHIYFTNKNLCFLGNGYPRETRNFYSRLSYDFRIQRTIDNKYLSDSFFFLFIQEICTAGNKLILYIIIYFTMRDNRLLRCTYYSIIKCFTHKNRVCSHFYMRRFIYNSRGVSRTDTNCRFTGRICCTYHTGTTCCKNQRDSPVTHKIVRQLNSRLVNPADNIFRCTGSHRYVKNYLRRLNRTALRSRMRGKNDTITGL